MSSLILEATEGWPPRWLSTRYDPAVQVTIRGTGFVPGSAARCNVSSTDTFEGFARGFAYDPEHVLQVIVMGH